ncbi:MAG: transcriptional regulator, AraC family [Solirubrobacterales bacterium]|nr:transcriptional regulator, AraC family [Solirubrobacterales bacterium]
MAATVVSAEAERVERVSTAIALDEFDVRSHPTADRPEAWASVLDDTHLPWRLQEPVDGPSRQEEWVRRIRFAGSAIVDCACDPCRGTRGAPEIAATDGEYVGVLITRRGREIVEQDGRTAVMTAGSLVAWDSCRPARFTVAAPLLKRTLFLARSDVARRCPRLGGLTAVDLTRRSAVAPLLVSYLDSLTVALPTLAAPDAIGAREAALELLSACLTPDEPVAPQSVRAGLYAAAVEHIDRRLGDPDLTPEQVAGTLATSLRTLQLAFEEHEDSVAGHIRRRRLARCHTDLSRPGTGTITAVAFRWGFTDSGNFARRFKQAYGIAPSELRRLSIRAPCAKSRPSPRASTGRPDEPAIPCDVPAL